MPADPPSLPRPPRLAAIVLDVDGTLYRQGPVRRGMLWRLLRAHLVRPLAGLRTMRALQAYRVAQEELRALAAAGGAPSADGMAAEQLRRAAERAGVEARELAPLVERWMERAPLDLVAAAARPGLNAFLDAAAARGIRLGVLSDYPARPKLAALGVEPRFASVLCAQDAAIGAFKPDPRGLRAVLAALDVPPERALFVGDRAEVDAAVAARAGVACVLVGRAARQPGGAPGAGPPAEAVSRVRDFTELARRLFPLDGRPMAPGAPL